MDDEVIFTVLEAIRKNSSITFRYVNNKKLVNVVPQKIIADYPYGRTYLIGTDKSTYKIDKISKIKLKSNLENTSYLTKDKPAQQLALLFTFNDSDDIKTVTDIKLRLKNEAFWMHKEKLSQSQYLYTAIVSDALSYAPWIRTFSRFVTPAPQCHKSLTERLLSDKEEALTGYGII